jgi:hypothetical protein
VDEKELLRFVTERLERAGVPYYVTGSFATVFFGEPRSTNDIDIVVVLSPGQVQPLLRQFPEDDFYFSAEGALDAIRHGSMFNLIHHDSGMKIDLIISKDSAYQSNVLARARALSPFEGYSATFITPEDLILNKLLFFREGGSEKHLRDIAGVLRISGKELDLPYIERWVGDLALTGEWEAVKRALI